MPGDKQKHEQALTSRAEDEPIDVTITPSCGNIFKDLGLPDPELLLAKAKLSIAIERAIGQRKLTRAGAAKLLGLTQPDLSDIIRGRLEGFTLDRLFRCLEALDQEIEIVVRPKRIPNETEATLRAA